MSLSKDNLMKAQDFKNLKARVKAEMTRRNGSGDVSSYGGSAYDYTSTPSDNTTIKEEHFNKVRDVLANINPSGLPSSGKKDNSIPAMFQLDAKLTLFEAQPRSATSNNDCATSCTGMCVTTCSTGCSGCTSCTSCSGCSGGCSSCNGCQGCSGAGWSGTAGHCDGCTSCSGSCDGCTGCSGLRY